MTEPTGAREEPGFGRFTRRAALGGMMAAVLTPTLLARAASVARAAPPPGDSVSPIPRFDHAVTSIGGMILVTGGLYLGPLASAQIFDPATDAWHEAAPMLTPRSRHIAVAMGDGSVLVAGGIYKGPLADAERYDPATDTWTAVAPMLLPRFGHSAAQTAGGVLVFGGNYLRALSAPEIFDGTSWQFA